MLSLVAVAVFASIRAEELSTLVDVSAVPVAPVVPAPVEKPVTDAVPTGKVAAAKKYLNEVVEYVKTLKAEDAKAFLSTNKVKIAAAAAVVGGVYVVYKLTRKYCPYFKAEVKAVKSANFIG